MQKNVAVLLSKRSVQGAVKGRGPMTMRAKFAKALHTTDASIEAMVYWYNGYYLRLSLGRKGFDSLIYRYLHPGLWQPIGLQNRRTKFVPIAIGMVGVQKDENQNG